MVELKSFQIFNVKGLEGEILGKFKLVRENIPEIHFNMKKDEIEFEIIEENKKEIFENWLKKEKKRYSSFIHRYINEIKKINDYTVFKEAKILEEKKTRSNFIKEKYEISCQYENLPFNVTFSLMPEVKLTTIDCVIPLAINSEGKLEEQKIEMHLEEETLQRMWEPIREKTRYRLQLLHMLRGA